MTYREASAGRPGTQLRWLAVFLALLVVAASAGVFASAASASQPGLVGVPADHIDRDVPAYAADAIPDRAAWGGVAATRAASTLSVTVTTRAAAHGRAAACAGQSPNKPPFCDGPELAVVLSDDTDHRGRTVALPLDAVRDAAGRMPRMAYGVHSSGDRWRTPTRVADGYLLVDVPRFSSNIVTFSGTVELVADPASNGSALSYTLDDLDAASAPNVTLTGRVASEWDNTTHWNPVVDGDTTSIGVGGNLDPTGPNGTPALTVRGARARNKHPDDYVLAPGEWHNTTLSTTSWASAARVCSRHSSDISGDGARLIVHIDGAEAATLGTTSFSNTTQCATFSAVAVDGDALVEIQSDPTAPGTARVDWVRIESVGPRNVSVSHGTSTTTVGDVPAGGEVAVDLSLSHTTDSLGWSVANAAPVNYSVSMTERTTTVDPAVEINNGSVSHAGTLAAGETVNLTGDAAWLQEGTNNVTVTVGDGTLSADAPAPEVAVTVTHDAGSDQSVDYVAETWSERYNVSKTWASDRTAATVTIPFAGDVVAVRSAETRADGGEWTAVAPSSIDMDGTTATVKLGSVDANTTTTVRVNGSKAPAINGSYHVRKPTVLGDELATEIEVDSGPVAIDVSGTPDGPRLHYLSNATYDASERSRVTAAGGNVLRLPDATSGDRATVRVLPLSVHPDTGDVVVEPTDPDGTPELRVSPGEATGDEVVFRYHQTVTDHRYVLESVSAGTERDSAVARSPVDLLDDDSSELLRIFDAGEVSSSDGDNPGPGGGPVRSAGTPLESTPALLLSALVGLLGVAYAARRWLSTWQQVAVLAVGGVVGGLAVVERASPEPVVARLVEPIGEGLGQATPVVAMFGLLIVGYAVYQWADGRDITVRGRFRR